MQSRAGGVPRCTDGAQAWANVGTGYAERDGVSGWIVGAVGVTVCGRIIENVAAIRRGRNGTVPLPGHCPTELTAPLVWRSAPERCEMARSRTAHSYARTADLSIQILDRSASDGRLVPLDADRLTPTGAGEIHWPMLAGPPPTKNQPAAGDLRWQG